MQLEYRICNLSDIDQLIYLSKTTFVASFESQNNPKDFEEYIHFAFSKEKLTSELSNPNSSFYFVYLGKDLIGYFKLNINDAQTDIKSEEAIELERIYVLGSFQGMGLGSQILDHVRQLALKTGKSYLWLGVWERNARAIALYQRNGFKKFGTHPYLIGDDEQLDWLMRFDLANLSDD